MAIHLKLFFILYAILTPFRGEKSFHTPCCMYVLFPAASELRKDYLPKEYSFNEHHSLSDQYPSCVDIVDVWPPPHSVLRPMHKHTGYADYMIRITFSRPIREKSKYVSYVTLSVSTIKPLSFQPFYSLVGSRSIWTYFRIANSMLYIQ